MVTDEERREVARKLRGLADGHTAVECSAVAKALDLDYEAHGAVAAFSADAVSYVADLIEPQVVRFRDCEWACIPSIPFGRYAGLYACEFLPWAIRNARGEFWCHGDNFCMYGRRKRKGSDDGE